MKLLFSRTISGTKDQTHGQNNTIILWICSPAKFCKSVFERTKLQRVMGTWTLLLFDAGKRPNRGDINWLRSTLATRRLTGSCCATHRTKNAFLQLSQCLQPRPAKTSSGMISQSKGEINLNFTPASKPHCPLTFLLSSQKKSRHVLCPTRHLPRGGRLLLLKKICVADA